MGNIGQKGKEAYLSGFSCGEAVAKVIRDEKKELKIPAEAIKACSAFKTGIGGSKGDLCGSLLAGLLIIGIKYGRDNNQDDISKVNQKSAQLYDKFLEKYGTVRCQELLKEFHASHTFNSRERKEFCSEIVRFVIEELENILE